MSKESCVVLFSSGLDSTVNLYKAKTELDVKMAITMNYGQKAFEKELEQSQKICKELNILHKRVDVPWLSEIATSSLVSKDKIPTDLVDINSVEASVASAKAVWVSNRNGLFINIAASFAEELKAKYVIVGFNLEEAETFPDNSVDFMNATNKALSYSTQNHVEVKCYTSYLNKKEIVQMGKLLNINYENIWPCYFTGQKICGKCESCQRYLAAL